MALAMRVAFHAATTAADRAQALRNSLMLLRADEYVELNYHSIAELKE